MFNNPMQTLDYKVFEKMYRESLTNKTLKFYSRVVKLVFGN